MQVYLLTLSIDKTFNDILQYNFAVSMTKKHWRFNSNALLEVV